MMIVAHPKVTTKPPIGDRSIKNVKRRSRCDSNRHEIKPDSFEQVCSMIDSLVAPEIVDIDTFFLPTKSHVTSYMQYGTQIEPEKDVGKASSTPPNSTYDDIIMFLDTLEKDCNVSSDCKTQDDLETARLQLEDREATIVMLKKQLMTERTAASEKFDCEQKAHAAELQAQKTKMEAVIKRHQKFIEQLTNEKKLQNVRCNELAEKLKELEAKQAREVQVLVDRHALEIQRARDLCLASEKIRRERWVENKTSKIRQMTVRGLEPELRSMVNQHQEEIQNIRSAHMKELQEVELRAIRRSNQQLEQLRLELAASHDKMLTEEKDLMRLRYQEKFDEQEALLQTQQKKFFQDLQQERSNFAEEQLRRDAERDSTVASVTAEWAAKLDVLTRQFEAQKNTLRANLEAERNVWMENYSREQNKKFQLAEIKIRDESSRDRDRQIEMVIGRLEKETREMKVNLQRTADSNLQCLREKFESDLQIFRDNEKLMKDKLDKVEQELKNTQVQLSQCCAELKEANNLVEKLSRDAAEATKIARQEVECEKRKLEEKIASLYREIGQINAEKNTHMSELYSKIKLIVTQKDLQVTSLQSKCNHLEKMVNQRRNEFIMKS